MKKTDIYEFMRLAIANNEISIQPWQEAFIKSLGQPGAHFVYRYGKSLRGELMWQIQLALLKATWLNGESTVSFGTHWSDVRKPVVIFDEFERFREVISDRDELWYQRNYLNPWDSDE